MSEENKVQYGAGGVPYVGRHATNTPPPPVEEEAPAELEIEEPAVVVSVIEDDRPLTDEQVIKKVTGKK